MKKYKCPKCRKQHLEINIHNGETEFQKKSISIQFFAKMHCDNCNTDFDCLAPSINYHFASCEHILEYAENAIEKNTIFEITKYHTHAFYKEIGEL